MTQRKIIPYNPDLKLRARELRKKMTLAEVLLWKRLKGGQCRGYDFDRQRPIDEYIVDFFCKDLMLAVEVDGESHNFKIKGDRIRQEKLESLGVSVLRFGDAQVKDDAGSVIEQIEGWIDRRGG